MLEMDKVACLTYVHEQQKCIALLYDHTAIHISANLMQYNKLESEFKALILARITEDTNKKI
ncbi:MAG: hypothetical protein ACRC6A_09375 [Fusobacteriaceae bacterium]